MAKAASVEQTQAASAQNIHAVADNEELLKELDACGVSFSQTLLYSTTGPGRLDGTPKSPAFPPRWSA